MRRASVKRAPPGLLAVIVLLAALLACRQRSSGDDSNPHSVQSAGSGAPTDAGADAERRANRTGASEAVASVSIRLAIVNRTRQVRYTDFGRSPFDHVVLERRVGDGWQEVRYREPPCSVPCPTNGSRPNCDPCSPPIPRPDWIEPQREVSHTWTGYIYSQQTHDDSCFCHQQRAAPRGRYRIRLCVFPDADCGAVPCTDPGAGPPTLQGQPICVEREFDHDGTDQHVPLEITR